MASLNSPQKITPFLWFNDNGEEAMNFYCSIFKNSNIKNVSPGPNGKAFTGSFELEGLNLHFLNGGPMYAQFTEAISLFVNCEDQKEVDYYWDKLTSEGGKTSRCGWLKDKYGLSWQIVPNALGRLMGDRDREKAGRVMQALLKMDKIIVADLEAAHRGE